MTRYISCTETAKLIRVELKTHFPGIKFSVRSRSYAGGASIDVEWLDGPAEPDVEKVTRIFVGSTFDGMIDLRSYVDAEWNGEQVHFGADHVMCNRKMSRSFVEAIVKQFCQSYGIPLPEIRGDEKSAWVNMTHLDYSQSHWLSDILRKTDAKDMHRAYEAETERESRECAEWKAGAEERERQAKAEQEKWEQEQKARREREEQERLRRQREQQEQERKQQEQRARDAFKAAQRAVLASRYSALIHLGLSFDASEADVMRAFRNKVKEMADGKGGYSGDMDFLVQVKEKALTDK